MATVYGQLLSFFRNLTSHTILTPKEISESTGINHNTVRREIKRLEREGVVEDIGRGEYRVPKEEEQPKFFRHMVGALAYCSGSKRTYYAITFTDDDAIDLEDELLTALLEDTASTCGNHRETGYSVDPSDSDNPYPQYPAIEVVDRI